MARLGRKHGLTPAKATEILAILTDGTPPFIELAAERAGLRRNIVTEWICDAETSENPLPAVVEFAREVRRIRALWMAQAMVRLQASTKETSDGARQLQWILERLDRELYKPPPRADFKTKAEQKAEVEAQEGAKAAAQTETTPAAIEKAGEALATPEVTH